MFTNQHHEGFTLVEMLVVLSVTALLMSLIVGLNKTGQRQVFLFREKSLMVANFNRIKAVALQTYLQPNRPCGFGIHVESASNRYVLFEDRALTPGDCGVASANRRYDSGEELIEGGIVQEYAIATSSVMIQSANFTDIVYVPPEPRVYIDYPAGASTGVIILQTVDGSTQITVQVNDAGQITTF